MTIPANRPTGQGPGITGVPAIVSCWFIYILRCRRGRLYTGITTDISRRLHAHARGRGARSLRGQSPLVLLYSRRVGERGAALRLEYRIKQLSRHDKASLVTGDLALDDLLPDREPA